MRLSQYVLKYVLSVVLAIKRILIRVSWSFFVPLGVHPSHFGIWCPLPNVALGEHALPFCVFLRLLASPFGCTQGHNKVSLRSEVAKESERVVGASTCSAERAWIGKATRVSLLLCYNHG